MGRTDVLGQVVSIPFSAVSTPRRIRLGDPNFQLPQQFEYLGVSYRGDSKVFVGINGQTAASTLSTTASLSGAALGNKQVFAVLSQAAPLSIWTKATSLSIQATGATAVAVSIVLGRV